VLNNVSQVLELWPHIAAISSVIVTAADVNGRATRLMTVACNRDAATLLRDAPLLSAFVTGPGKARICFLCSCWWASPSSPLCSLLASFHLVALAEGDVFFAFAVPQFPPPISGIVQGGGFAGSPVGALATSLSTAVNALGDLEEALLQYTATEQGAARRAVLAAYQVVYVCVDGEGLHLRTRHALC
jgi:hypothetical protein